MSTLHSMPKDVSIVIPAYNPDERLLSLVLELKRVGAADIIIINDGSGNDSDLIFDTLKMFDCCTVIEHSVNMGRGIAIKDAMALYLEQRNGKGIVTVDGDGHHRICDIIGCAKRMVDTGKVIFGTRDKKDKTISPRGRYGNKITSFAISVVTEYKVSDPLTSLRGIPARFLPIFIKTKGERYDFETNMILDMNRNKVPIRTFKIASEYYNDGKKSHFKVVRDSLKIGIEIVKYFGQQFKYMLSSIVSYLFEYILFRILLSYIDVSYANYLARILSCILNFVINKNVVFKTKKNYFSTVTKYVIVTILLMIVATESIVIINKAFMTANDTVAKYVKLPIDFIMFFIGYLIQKKWVFKSK